MNQGIRIIITSLILGCMILFSAGACKTPGSSNNGKDPVHNTNDPDKNPHTDPTGDPETFVENQPEFPDAKDDPYFKEPAAGGEVFRVLITRNNYQVRQLAAKESIRRKKDPAGDKYQVDTFRKHNDLYDFKSWTFKGMLRVRLNPHSGAIEFIEYVKGKAPRAWQVTEYFRDDLSRFSFNFPRKAVTRRSFVVRFEWRIQRRAGMTKDEARTRAIDFLKSHKLKR